MKQDRADFDADMMRIALSMARRGLGLTAPNPSVGAVIADENTGEVISRAVTAPGGRPHAETIAIREAGARAKGATIYVTLEPCSHQGKTGPCADAIIRAGLKRAVVAIEDPDPRVAGRGLDRLRAAGLEVVRGIRAEDARWLARGHIVRVTERRPFIILKLALDSGGNVPRGTGNAPLFVTSPDARAHGHLLRAEADAILVGSGTMQADNPELTCRLPGLGGMSPVRVILSRSLDFSPEARLFDDAREVPVLCIAGAGVDEDRKAALEKRGAEVIETETVGGTLWLPAVLEALVARGITRLLVEGGPKVWREFAEHALADEVALYIAAATSSDEGQAHEFAKKWLGDVPLAVSEMKRLGPDVLWRMRWAKGHKGA